MNMFRLLFFSSVLSVLPITAAGEGLEFAIEEVAAELEYPWSLAQLADHSLLVTVKPGRLWHLDPATGKRTLISGTPEVAWVGQGGLLDVLVAQEWVYLSYSRPCRTGFTTAVGRYRLRGDRLVDGRELFRAQPCGGLTWHFAGRMARDEDGFLYLAIGDRGERTQVQDLGTHWGKIVRLHSDGRVPEDNPFVATPGALPEIYSYGHRNPQGMTKHPDRNEIWIHEHGPKGGDELNLLHPGANYGWPKVTFGREYTGGSISPYTEAPGVTPPHHHWTPSIAPSGLAIVPSFGPFASWGGQFLVGALVDRDLRRVHLADSGAVTEIVLDQPRGHRIRDVRVLGDDLVYVLTDARDGRLLRLRPAERGTRP